MQRISIRKSIVRAGRFGLYGACGLLSLYILASGYESIYNKALPFVDTLAPVNLTVLSHTYDLAAAIPKPSSYGQFGRLVTLSIPNPTGVQRLSVVAPIDDNGSWLARASTMHLLIPTDPLNGNVSTAILYCRGSFRTITASTLPAVGSNLFVDTDQSWRYIYKVSASKAYAPDYQYIPTANPTKGKLIIFCNDQTNHANVVIEADIIAVQGTTQ
jgi:hypothetical protein